MELKGRECVVRTQVSGVFIGTVQEKDGTEVTMTDARRVWYWAGAASLSQLAAKGTSKPNECKFPQAVPEILVMGVIEIIPLTKEAKESLARVPVWEE